MGNSFVTAISLSGSQAGSSPRLWGTRPPARTESPPHRFIPTSVGNSKQNGSCMAGGPVHPHVCGELRISFSSSTNAAVHPHVCGELVVAIPAPDFAGGSSPRLWGTHPNGQYTVQVVRFIPTSLWGTLSSQNPPARSQRFIPTSVGNSFNKQSNSIEVSVHPHVCGNS